jgi:hypothetical protein
VELQNKGSGGHEVGGWVAGRVPHRKLKNKIEGIVIIYIKKVDCDDFDYSTDALDGFRAEKAEKQQQQQQQQQPCPGVDAAPAPCPH